VLSAKTELLKNIYVCLAEGPCEGVRDAKGRHLKRDFDGASGTNRSSLLESL
jgi:hypothetical protein